MVTARYYSFPWTCLEGQRFQWKPNILAEWRQQFDFTDPTRVKKTFAATTQLYPSIFRENSLPPKNPKEERLPGLGAPYRQISCKGKTFLVGIIPYKFKVKECYLFVFFGLLSRFSAVYNLGFKKSALATYQVLRQFIADNWIPKVSTHQ